jgi:hypothetical protein
MVTLRSDKGDIRRVVVEDFGSILTVTTHQELEDARKAGRPPAVAGFPKTALLEIADN